MCTVINCIFVGWARTIYIYTYIRCTNGNLSREITIHTVIYGVYIRSGQPYIIGDFPANDTVYTPYIYIYIYIYIYGSGQPYLHVLEPGAEHKV